MPGRKIAALSLFYTVFLLLFVNQVRSGVLVDSSFLPRYLLLALLLAVISLALFGGFTRQRFTLFDLLFLAFAGWNLASAGWATVPSEALTEALLVVLSFGVWTVTRLLLDADPRFEKRFIAVALVAMACSFALAFFKMSRLTFFDPYQVRSIAANNNLFSGYLLLCLPLALAGYARFRGMMKYLSALCGVTAVFFMVIVQSRAAYLGLGFATLLALAGVMVRFRVHANPKNLAVTAASLLLLAAGIGLFYHSLDDTRRSYFLSKVPVWQYFRSYDRGVEELLEKRKKERAALTGISEFDFAGSYYENASLRMIFWKRSATLLAQHPMLGTGAGNWRIMAPSVPEPANPDHTFKNYTYSQPHNEWIGFATELGLPGLALAVVFFLGPAAAALARIAGKRKTVPLTALLYASFLAGFCLYACFDFPFRRVEHNILYFSINAFLFHTLMKTEEPAPLPVNPWKLVRFLLLAGLMATVAVGVMRIKGEYYTRAMFSHEGKDQEKVIGYGKKALSRCYRITPNALPVEWFIGVAQFRLDSIPEAYRSFSAALRVTPCEVRVLNDHAASLFRMGHVAEAAAELRSALGLDPHFDDARYNLAALHYYAGRRDSALWVVKPCRDSQKKKDFVSELTPVTGQPQ